MMMCKSLRFCLLTVLTLSCLLPGLLGYQAAWSQQISPEMLQKAAAQTGMSQDELLRKYKEAQGGGITADLPQEPGRTELPSQAQPQVVLPFATELAIQDAAEEAVAGLAAEDELALPDSFFGADFFRLDPGVFNPTTFGPVPADYLVGVGDQLVIDVWGEVELRYERIVDRDGAIIIPKAGKIHCYNRTLTEVNQAVRDKLSRSYSGIDRSGQGGSTFVEVSLGNLRAIRVYVVGEVAQPGAYEMSSVSTIFTALYAAGGPGTLGSLRDIRLMRGDQPALTLDLYAYLLSGQRENDAILRDGDTVFVPPRQLTVAISGQVRRSLRFELKEGEGVRDLIRFAGGFTPEAATEMVHVQRIVPPRDRQPQQPDREFLDLDLRNKMKYLLRDGDRVSVDRSPDRMENWVVINGNVKRPGRYEFKPGLTATGLIGQAGGLWQDTLNERALIDRIDERGNYQGLDFPLGEVIQGAAEDPQLQPRDQVRVFSIWDVQDRYQVAISGQVRAAGSFDFREGMTMRDLVLKAGGLTDGADVVSAEVSRLKDSAIKSRDPDIPPGSTIELIEVPLGEDWLTDGGKFLLQAHDRVAIRKLPWWQLQRTVTVRGEVPFPGVYALDSPCERLSAIIARAGGLKPTAYAPGTRIVRSKDQIGNIALDLDKALKKPGGEHDPILESGDEILVPQERNIVKVTGAVSFPTSVVFESGTSIGDYVRRSGGFAEMADKGKTHVIYPNGMSRPVRKIWRDPEVLPGSTIVVPYETPRQGASKLETMREITAIMAGLATVWLVIDSTN